MQLSCFWHLVQVLLFWHFVEEFRHNFRVGIHSNGQTEENPLAAQAHHRLIWMIQITVVQQKHHHIDIHAGDSRQNLQEVCLSEYAIDDQLVKL